VQANKFSGNLIGNDLGRGYLVNPALLHKLKEGRKEWQSFLSNHRKRMHLFYARS